MQCTSAKYRRAQGSQLAEFGAALVLIVICFVLPIIDFGIVPIRAMMAQELVAKEVRRLSFAESFSGARNLLENNSNLLEQLNKIGGIKVLSKRIQLRVASSGDAAECCYFSEAGQIPAKYLPGNSDRAYALILELKLLLSPLFLLEENAVGIPGLSAPFAITLCSSHAWENLGRDPESGNFYLNE